MPNEGLTPAALLTVAGIAAGAALTTTIVQLLKNVAGPIGSRISGALAAFVITAVLYVIAGLSTGAASVDSWFAVFVAWVTCATAAVGVYATVSHVATARNG